MVKYVKTLALLVFVGVLMQCVPFIPVSYAAQGDMIWNFNANGNYEGWGSFNHVSGTSVAGGFLTATVSGTDPYMHSAEGLSIDTSKQKQLQIRMKNSTSGTEASVYWITNTDSTWNETKSARFAIKANDGGYTTYTLDIGDNPAWKDTVTRLRIDPVNSVSSGSTSIDYIKVIQVAQIGWNFNKQSDLEGWNAINHMSGVTVEKGYLNAAYSGTDPFLLSPDNLNLNAAVFSKLLIRMQNSTASNNAAVYFITSADTQWNESKKADFSIVASDQGYTTYTINMAANANWSGSIRQIRIDPQNGSASGSLKIDYVHLYNSGETLVEFANSAEQPSEYGNISSLAMSNGILSFSIGSSTEGWFRLPMTEALDSTRNYLSIRLKTAVPLKAKIHFGHEEASLENYDFFINADAGQYQDIKVILSESVLWKGSYPHIRLSFQSLNNTAATLYLDRVKFEKRDIPTHVVVSNGTIKTGVSLDWGGAIDYLAIAGQTTNFINRHDAGRLSQQSYYGVPYTDVYYNGQLWSWNPVQGGDQYFNESPIVDYSVDTENRVIYVKTRPLDWAKNNVPTDAYMESRITLLTGSQANLVKFESILTDYSNLNHVSKDQELPCYYAIHELDRYVTYKGNAPFTGGSLTEASIYDSQTRYSGTTEMWSAWTNANGFGIGLYSPVSRKNVYSGFYGVSDWGEYGDATGYAASVKFDRIRRFEPYMYTAYLALGNVGDMRSWFTALHAANPVVLKDTWSFNNGSSSEGWVPGSHVSSLVVSSGVLEAQIGGNDPFLVQNNSDLFVDTSVKKKVEIVIRNASQATSAKLYWTTNLNENLDENKAKSVSITSNDTGFKTYTFDLTGNPNWINRIISLRLDFDGASSGNVHIDSIRVY